MPSWLITGANRGIGLATVENLLKNDSNFVIATTRSAAPELNALAAKNKNLKVVTLEITSQSSIDAAVATVTPLLPNGLDYLVNNAGKNPQPLTKFEDLDLDAFGEEMTFNTVVPLRVSRSFLPLVKKSDKKTIIFISSVLASSQITFMMANQFNAYSVAKAALNMLARKWGASLKYEGVTTAAIHPGWTQTDLGAPLKDWMAKYAPNVPHLTTDAAGAGVVKISEALTLEKTASFWHFDGTNLPW
jgi:NAD(P)-dependent dehydrogenase (short-subunit alcohol dehydrogenase family)